MQPATGAGSPIQHVLEKQQPAFFHLSTLITCIDLTEHGGFPVERVQQTGNMSAHSRHRGSWSVQTETDRPFQILTQRDPSDISGQTRTMFNSIMPDLYHVVL